MNLSAKGRHRLFFAIDFEDDFKDKIAQWTLLLDINGRRVAPENYHLTLQFLGDVNNHQVFDIIDTMEIPEIKPFELSINKTGYFPKNELLFCELDEGLEKIQTLSTFIAKNLQSLSFIKREKKRFHPHITIARDAKPPVDFEVLENITTKIKYFCLMESIFIKSGIHYEVVESWPLYTPTDKEKILGLDLL
ncbi:RNA 2',3'-cyclic phosphodiesterase [Pleionea sediminis]|uniref:RNA 2',3'-cyclic phosphodiesterase n=1 Tax=Pleionea sediminis TaxID=2569479 RepID=UPI001186908A|nr:RNA 2',3'-cyclic phosphodiesterase [Pleionea sediminis]